jgi:hypothetical protein
MALTFTAASSQFLSMPSAPVASGPLTMACWFRTSNVTNTLSLICINDTATNNHHCLLLRGDIAGDPVNIFSQSGASSGGPITTTGFSANTWGHACGVFSSNASRSVYFNGGGVATNTTNVPTSGLIQSSIGGRRVGPSALNGVQFMEGQIAEVGIWNAALTAAEIASLAKGMTPDKIRPQNLVFYAPLVRDLIDQKGGLALTNNNGATVANHPRVYA